MATTLHCWTQNSYNIPGPTLCSLDQQKYHRDENQSGNCRLEIKSKLTKNFARCPKSEISSVHSPQCLVAEVSYAPLYGRVEVVILYMRFRKDTQ